MKKTVNLLRIIIMIVVVILIAVCALLFFRKKEKTLPTNDVIEKNNYIELLKLDNIEEIEEFIAYKSIQLQTSDDPCFYSIGNLPVEGQLLSLYYMTDEQGKFVRVDGEFDVELEKADVSSIQSTWDEFCRVVRGFFDMESEIGDIDYDIYASEGNEIDAYAEESFEQILNKKANLGLSAIDRDGTFWNVSAYIGEKNNTLHVEFFHSYEIGVYENGLENIVLNEPVDVEAEQ